MDRQREDLQLEASLLYRGFTGGAVSPYTGVGLKLGTTVGRKTTISKLEYKELRLRDPNGTDYVKQSHKEYFRFSETSEDLETGEEYGFVGDIFIPVGIDVRLHNDKGFLGWFHLFGEVQPGFRYLQRPGLGYVRERIVPFGIGMKFLW